MRKIVTDPRKRRALTPILKQRDVQLEIGKRIVDVIEERTLKGFDKDGENFAPYSKAYRQSDTFKIFKGGKRKPNLKLSGEMLASVDVVKLTSTGVEIGFVDDEQEDKASGHVKGDNPNRMPIRDFWGLPDRETLTNIIDGAVREAEDMSLLNQIAFIEEALNTEFQVAVGEQEPFLLGF
jgi:hypothetical protein